MSSKVLVIDDEPSLLETINLILSKQKFDVITAASGIEGMKILQQDFDNISLVITDLAMPGGFDGMDVLEKTKELDSEIPVIMITAYGNVETAVKEIMQFAGKVIGKVTIDQLDQHLMPRPTIESIQVSDIVEITSGPFKGSRARITSMSVTREEITLELLDSRISIPLVMHADNVRKLESASTTESLDNY